MPLTDPRAGRAFIWIVSSFLFLSIVAGGGCLVMYMILPPTDTTSWLPVTGVTLVCLPWSFWLLTFLYRIISRFCFSRASIGGGGAAVGAQAVAAQSVAVNEGNDVNLDQFETAMPVEEEERKGGHRKKSKKRRNSSSSSSSSSSSESNESEIALAISMGS